MLPLPHYFGTPLPALFGHLHLPADGVQRGPAVVLCPAFGQEAMSSHRALRVLAERLAAQGCACLRFDPPGTGDSADWLGPGHERGLAAWPEAIGQAIDHLKAVLGVTEVVVVGLRLGALMAALASESRKDVAAMVAWAPLVRGHAFVRECKAFGMATLARAGLPARAQAGTVETGGYVLSEADIAFLQSIDLSARSARPAPRVLCLDRAEMPVADRWVACLRSSGCEVELAPASGYEAMMRVPHFSVVPEVLFETLVPWVKASATMTSVAQWSAVAIDERLAHRMACGRVTEQAGWLLSSSPSPLSWVVSEAEAGARAGRPAVLMVNTGGEHRVGTNRMYTTWARHWADRGWLAMRLDLSGLGNSPARPGEGDDEIHLRHATEDIRAALHHLRASLQAGEVHLVGLCSGAFHALTAAFEGEPVASVTAINQMVYFWQARMPLAGEASEAVVVAITQGLGRSMCDPARWRRLLAGQVNVRVIVRAVLRRGVHRARLAWRPLARALGRPVADDLRGALQQTTARGVRLHLVFSEGEPGLTMVHEQAGPAVGRLAGSGLLRLSVLPQADHTFTQSEAQQRLFDTVDQTLQQWAGNRPAAVESSFQQPAVAGRT